MGTEIIQSEVLDWAKSYNGPKFHALLCDPPYELGFMSKHWDQSGIAFRPETWEALAEHLYPGAFGMAFAAARGWHRMAVAIEDAGLIIHPSIFLWSYGSGFPKATRIRSDPRVGTGSKEILTDIRSKSMHAERKNSLVEREVTKATGRDSAFEGYRYGMQALKPAAEPIIVFQKPYEGKPSLDIVATGAGALNIKGTRIEVDPKKDVSQLRTMKRGKRRTKDGWGMSSLSSDQKAPVVKQEGRWPANLVLTHHPDCVHQEDHGEKWWECHNDCPVRKLDKQSGILKSGFMPAGQEREGIGYHGGLGNHTKTETYADEGGASRFFHQSGWSAEIFERLNATEPVRYEAKAGQSERHEGVGENLHPTLKPLELCKWLATLLLPPAGYAPRRLLVPFAGTASECVGAEMAGWEEILGVEQEKEYADIARARVAFWVSTIQLDLFKF